MEQGELPLGFGMALAQHPAAMQRFSKLSADRQAVVLQQAHAAVSKEEMQQIVQGLETVSSLPNPSNASVR